MNKIKTLSPAEAQALIESNSSNSNFIILDLRSASAYDKARIGNAINLDYHKDDFDDKLSNLARDKIILVYCDRNAKANIAAEMLEDMGARQIYKITGGMQAWQKFNS